MDVVFFLVRHTPFWAVPMFIIGGEFSYRHWLKGHRVTYKCFFGSAVIGFCCTLLYCWAGGPEKSVKTLAVFLRYIAIL